MRRVRWFLMTLSLGLLLTGDVWAQDSQPTDGGGEFAQPFLYEVVSDAGTSYLFGTFHIGISLDDLDPAVLHRLDEARILFVETDVTAINPFEMLQMAMLPPGTRLSDFMEAETWAEIESTFSAMLPGMDMATMQPWVLETMWVASQMPAAEPMDLVLLMRAREAGQELGFLEDWHFQMEMMNSLPLDQSIEDLVEWFAAPGEMVSDLEQLVTGYQAGDVTAIESLLFDPEEIAERPDFFEITLFERNRNWMPPLTEAINQGGAFIAVGLGHLIGDQGLVRMLQDAGYTVTRHGVSVPQ